MFVYSESVEHSMSPTGAKVNVLGVLNALTPMCIPSMFSFSVTLGLIEVEMNKAHKLQLKIIDATNGEIVVDTEEIQLPIESINQRLPLELQGYTFSMDFRNIPINNEGIYKTYVFFDGELLGEYPVHVKAALA